MSVPKASTNRNSAASSYHLIWGLWIGLSLIYTAAYLRVAVLDDHLLQGRVLALTFLFQAFLVPAYTWCQKFVSCAGAAIQSASTAMAVVGLPASLLILTATSFPHFTVFTSIDVLQFGYVATILLLSGVAGGTALGILRWRILQAQPVQAVAEPAFSWWRQYFRSAMSWAASVTLYCWLIGAGAWAISDPDRDKLLPLLILLGIAGLFFVAPIPVLSRSPEADSRRKRIWKYFKHTMVPVAIFVGIALVIGFPYSLSFFPLMEIMWVIILGTPCFIWAVVYGWSSGPPPKGSVQFPQKGLASLHLERRAGSNWVVVWLALAGQVCALFAGLLATAPVSLGLHGVGCLTVNTLGAEEYWFWKAYKGLASEGESVSQMVLRPSVNARACVILDHGAMALISDPKVISKGYLGAARVWSWLIDPEQWEGERTKQIRKELTRLLGRDFSSYEELEAWWKKNNKDLLWSGTDELLEVRQPELSARSEPSDDHLREPYVYVSVAGKNPPAQFFGREPMGNGPNRREFPLFGDREASLRGLKLDAASSIDIVTGEQQRRVQEYLHNLFKEDFSTKEEWQEFFNRSPRQNPWRVRRNDATDWIESLHRNRSDPENNEKNAVLILQGDTGLNYSRGDDFIEWLQNPENTRFQEWERAEEVFRFAYDTPGFFSNKRGVLDWLKIITDQTFDSPDQWVQWWQENRSNLVLSEDGLSLVSNRK